MNEPTNYQKRKRKRLEDEYDGYSISTMPYILRDKCSVKIARDFHDRALTCIDLANIYLRNGLIDDAIIYLQCGIIDIKRAKDIHETLDSKPNDIQKCKKIKRLFTQHVKTLCIAKKSKFLIEDSLSKEDPDRFFNNPERPTTDIAYPKCSPEVDKKISDTKLSPISNLSLFSSNQTDDSRTVNALSYRH